MNAAPAKPAPKAKTPKEATICACGCGGKPKHGKFLPGHDAKLKKRLFEAASGGDKDASEAIKGFGWEKSYGVFQSNAKAKADKDAKAASDKAAKPAKPAPKAKDETPAPAPAGDAPPVEA